MAFYSGFFNSKGLDRTYTAEDHSYLSVSSATVTDTYGQNSLTASGGVFLVPVRRGSTDTILSTIPDM